MIISGHSNLTFGCCILVIQSYLPVGTGVHSPSNSWFLGPTQVSGFNGFLISLAIFAGLTGLKVKDKVVYCSFRLAAHLEKSGNYKVVRKNEKSQGKLKSVSRQKVIRRRYLATLECKKTFWRLRLRHRPCWGSLQCFPGYPSWWRLGWLPPS